MSVDKAKEKQVDQIKKELFQKYGLPEPDEQKRVDTSRQEEIIRALEAEVLRLQRLNQLSEQKRGEAEAEVERLKQYIRENCVIVRPYANLKELIFKRLRGKYCVYGGLIEFSKCVHVQEVIKREEASHEGD